MNTIRKLFSNKNAIAWLVFMSTVALHVFDEVMTEFLPFYNQSVINLREQLGFFPAPTFPFGIWLGGLVGAIIIGYCITPLIARGGKVIRLLVVVLGILMIFNALIHLLGSIYLEKVIPGVWSSPLLLIAAIWLAMRGLRGEWQIRSN